MNPNEFLMKYDANREKKNGGTVERVRLWERDTKRESEDGVGERQSEVGSEQKRREREGKKEQRGEGESCMEGGGGAGGYLADTGMRLPRST